MESTNPQQRPRIVIALVHPAARAAVASVLAWSDRVAVGAVVGGLDEAVAAVQRTGAAVLVIDSRLVGRDVGALARSLGAAVILVGLDDEAAFAAAARKAG